MVDIVIITWNSVEYLKACLKSIDLYTRNIPFRLIIVDNGSIDGTDTFLENLRSKNTIVKRNTRNLGYPKALQQGYNLSTSEYVCLMNDDVIVSPGWLNSLIEVMEKDSNIGILGPVRPGAHFIHPYTGALSKTLLEESKKKRRSPRGRLNFFKQNKDYPTFVNDYKKANMPLVTYFNSMPHIISTCCALVRREAVEKAGDIVDTRFVKYGGDDVDLCWRLMKSGYSLAITAESYIHHFEHVSMTRNEVDRQKYLKVNAIHLYKKWEKEIHQYLTTEISQGLSREQILQKSWLLQRLSDAVGKPFWAGIN